MRNLSFIVIFALLTGCSEEPVGIPPSFKNPNWSKLIYETSDFGIVDVNNASKITTVFKDNFYEVLSGDGSFIRAPKESLGEFDLVETQTIVPLESASRFILGGADNTSLTPRYGIKLMDDRSNAISYFHDNAIKGTFLPADQEQFYGVLESPVYEDPFGDLALDITVIEFSHVFGRLDTVSTDVINISGVSSDQSSELRAIMDGDEIYFIVQSQIIRFNVSTQSTSMVVGDGSLENLFFLGNELVTQVGRLKLEIYDKNLVKQSEVTLQSLISGEENVKNTILKVYAKDDRVYLAMGVSEILKQNSGLLSESVISMDLLVLDQNLNKVNQFTILEPVDNSSAVLWETQELISVDVRTGFFGIFLFQNKFADSSYEYLLRRVDLN